MVSGFSVSQEMYDVFVYDGPSGTLLAQRNSNLEDGTPYYPQRFLGDYGLAISGVGTRLLAMYSVSVSLPVAVGFQTLPPPP